MTDAPIYLVSACASGEEFVAAFRRYADKHGLFVPIADPLASGRRGRFAVTLRDGGVMIEGEADIVSSARAASVLHGRVGMTLKFVTPDDASKTMLGELEKARLSMRPPPPSVAPRPASIPAEPRPVPPAAQGRIDAVNALAECVAIAAPDVLEAFALTALAPSKPGQKLGLPPLAKPAAAPAKPTTALPPIAAKPSVAQPPIAAQAPAVKPITAPVPVATPIAAQAPAVTAPAPIVEPPVTAPAAIVDRGPTSETMIVALPPQPDPPSALAEPATDVDLDIAVPRTGTRPGAPPAPPPPPSPTLAATMSAIPLPAGPSSSAPTEIGAAIIDLALVADPADELTPEAEPIDAAVAPEPTTSPEVAALDPAPDADADADAVDGAALDAGGSATAVVVATAEDHDGSARTQVHAGVPPREPSGSAREPARLAAIMRDTPTSVRAQPFPTMRGAPIDLTQTLRTPPPEMEEIRALLASDRRPMASEHAPEVEIAEPTDLSMAPPPPSPPQDPRGRRTAIGVAVIPAAVSAVSGEMMSAVPPGFAPALPPPDATPSLVPPEPAPAAAPAISGAAPSLAVPPPLGVAPPLPGAASVIVDDPAADEPTGADRVVEDEAIDLVAPAPGGKLPAPVEEPTPSEYWTISPGGQLAAKPKDPHRARSNSSAPIAIVPASTPPAPARSRTGNTVPPPGAAPGSGPLAVAAPPSGPVAAPSSGPVVAPAPVAPAPVAPIAASPSPAATVHAAGAAPPTDPATGLPSGDWLIALDPGAPDGWSEPFETVSPHPLTDDPAAADPAADEPAHRPSLPITQMPALEPKVQIDPTLIEPAAALAADEPYSRPSAPAPAMYAPTGFAPTPMPMPGAIPMGLPTPMAMPAAMPMAMPTPMPGAMAMPGAMPMAMGLPPTPPPPFVGAHAPPAYPMDPAYQMVPIATLPAPRAATANGSGLSDPRYPSDPALLPVPSNRRRIIIVLASAILAVAIGIIVLTVVTGKRDPAPPADRAVPGAPREAPAPRAPHAALPGHAGEATHADVAPGAIAPRVVEPGSPEAVAPAAPSTACFADVVSVPAGAEIVIGESDVIGTTPQKVTLPCGDKVELTIRKAHLVAAMRTITPTADGVKLRVALAKQMFQVKVSSTPPGATITLAGKPLGVTPTTIKVPAFEASTLSITKDGYTAESEKVAPRSNGTAVHSTLKKLDHRPR